MQNLLRRRATISSGGDRVPSGSAILLQSIAGRCGKEILQARKPFVSRLVCRSTRERSVRLTRWLCSSAAAGPAASSIKAATAAASAAQRICAPTSAQLEVAIPYSEADPVRAVLDRKANAR